MNTNVWLNYTRFRIINNIKHLRPTIQLRFFADEKDGDAIDVKSNEQDDKSQVEQDRRSDLEKAKLKLSEMLIQMKIEKPFETGESISQSLAKPKYYIRKSARLEQTTDEKEEKSDEIISKDLDKRLVIAAKTIANTLTDKDLKQETESELLKMLTEYSIQAKSSKGKKSGNLMEIIKEMKVDRSKPKRRDYEREDIQIKPELSIERKLVPERKQRKSFADEVVNLYKSEPLGIFDPKIKQNQESPVLRTWNRLMKEEITMTITHPPTNPYEEMIRWTEQGKLWKFPIDNEQGLEEEAEVPFYQHVLLDHLLEGFPTKGPVRQFMELVLIALSKNAFITVQRKYAIVDWYRDYFKQKEGILRASGALG